VVRIPPIRLAERSAGEGPRLPSALLKQLEGAILYEDKGIMVLNKPSGLAVHGGSGLSFGAIEALRAMRPEARFLELAHRLDRDTSGCLVIAKKRSALRAFHELLRTSGVDKHYHALVMGEWRGGTRKIEAPLRKNTLRSGERIVQVDAEEGKPSLSYFSPVERFEGATLMDVRIITGRTHQVRVHAAHSGHPIAGDAKYGDEAFNAKMKGLGLKRLFLHAHEVAFTLDEETGTIRVTAPLDETLRQTLERLRG
jgi:23S rRNA pseudouridine955/2504/2580 synthase